VQLGVLGIFICSINILLVNYILIYNVGIIISVIHLNSICKIDERCLFLCVNTNESFQMYFSSSHCRQRFYDLVKNMIDNDKGIATNLNKELHNEQVNVVLHVSFNDYI